MKNYVIAVYKFLVIFRLNSLYLKKTYKQPHRLERLKMVWAKHVLRILNVKVQVANAPSPQRPLLFLGTHISYIDILVLMATTPEIVFVAKAEIENWPVIGKACKRVGIIFVKRENKSSRGQARQDIVRALSTGKRVVIFPSGTTTLFEEKPWRNGPFEILQSLQEQMNSQSVATTTIKAETTSTSASETKKFLQPFRLTYTPLRQAAYVGDDTFAPHVVKLLQGPQVSGSVEFGEPTHITHIEETRDMVHNWVRALDFKIIPANDCYLLRSLVLRNGKSFEHCTFPEDQASTTLHFGAFKNGQLVSIVTLIELSLGHEMRRKIESFPPARVKECNLTSDNNQRVFQLRGMATDPDFQGQGIGAALVRHAERHLRRNKIADAIVLNAREKAFSFYEKLGYQDVDGTIFDTEHGPHKTMWKTLVS